MTKNMYEDWKPGEQTAKVRALADNDIDNGPFPSLSLIADTYDDDGQPEIASGYRWLIEHQKTPRSSGPKPDPYWVFTGDESTLKIAEYLPANIRSLMNAMNRIDSHSLGGPLSNHFHSRSAAYRTAAICMGAHLNRTKAVVEVAMLTDEEKYWHTIPDVLKPYFSSLSVPIPTMEERVLRRKQEIERLQSLEARGTRDRVERIARQITDDFERQMALGLGMTTNWRSAPNANPCYEIPLPDVSGEIITSTQDATTLAILRQMEQRMRDTMASQRVVTDPNNLP